MCTKSAATLASVLAALLSAAPALGADLPRGRGASPAPVYYAPPPPAFVWTGFYAGVQGGWGFADFQGASGRALVASANGGLIGLGGGYNYQIAPNFLLGAEADFSFAWIGNESTPLWGVAARGNTDDLLTIRGRAGYVMDRTLIYRRRGFRRQQQRHQREQGGASLQRPSVDLPARLDDRRGRRIHDHDPSCRPRRNIYTPRRVRTAISRAVLPDLRPASNTSTVKGGINYHF